MIKNTVFTVHVYVAYESVMEAVASEMKIVIETRKVGIKIRIYRSTTISSDIKK